ncbi:MAG: hypothetical protein ACMUJM_20905 [bacterium]
MINWHRFVSSNFEYDFEHDKLAAGAAFLARLHREKSIAEWLMRIIRERIELEEEAFIEAKRDMVTKGST